MIPVPVAGLLIAFGLGCAARREHGLEREQGACLSHSHGSAERESLEIILAYSNEPVSHRPDRKPFDPEPGRQNAK